MRLLLMLHKAVAISTLAVLAAGELTNQAIASPDLASSTAQSATSNYVVPVEASPKLQPTAAIAPPEVVVEPEFAQSTQTPTQSTSTNNVVVTTTSESTQAARTPVSSTNQPSGTSAQSTTANAIAQSSQTPAKSTITNDLALTAIDVQVTGATEELQQIVLKTIGTRPGGSTNQSQLDSDVAAILNTGLFTDARV